MNKILVTGGLGFIGSNLIPVLQDKLDAEIRILDNMENPSNTQDFHDVEIINGDIRDASAVSVATRAVDVIIHLAAHTRVIDSIENPKKDFDINVLGTMNILHAMRENEVETIVSASTGGAILGDIEPPVHEEMAPRPLSPYGASKLAAEGYLSAFSGSYGIRAKSLRFSNIYGIHSKNKGSAVAAFFKDIKREGRVTVYGDGSQTRDFLYVGDLAHAIVAAVKSDTSSVIQMGSGQPTSINKLLSIIENVLGGEIPFEISYQGARAGEVLHTYCDITRAKTQLNFKPRVSLSDGVQKTWDWYIEEAFS